MRPLSPTWNKSPLTKAQPQKSIPTTATHRGADDFQYQLRAKVLSVYSPRFEVACRVNGITSQNASNLGMCLNRTTRANYVNTTPTLRHIDQLHTKFKKYPKTTPFWTEILMPKSGPCSRNRRSGAKHRVCTFLKSDLKVGDANVSFGPLLPLGPFDAE